MASGIGFQHVSGGLHLRVVSPIDRKQWRRFNGVIDAFSTGIVIQTRNEIADRHVQNLGEIRQSIGASPIGSTLIFLDSLEDAPELFDQLRLTYFKQSSTQP